MKNEKNLSDTRGNSFGFGFFLLLLRLFGLKTACIFVQPVTLCYTLFDRQARKKILPYIRHRFPKAGKLKRLWHIWRLYICFGESMLKQFAGSMGMTRLAKTGNEEIDRLNFLPGGYIILFSHFGSWMAVLGNIDSMTKIHNILMRKDQNIHIDKLRGLRDPVFRSMVRSIPIEENSGGLPEASLALGRGEVVCIMGDRSLEAKPLRIPFLGEEASFPAAAFLLAARMKVPVVCIFSEPDPDPALIRADFSTVIRPEMTGRNREQLKQYAEIYVKRLEEKCMKDPYNCFLFDDIWEKKS